MADGFGRRWIVGLVVVVVAAAAGGCAGALVRQSGPGGVLEEGAGDVPTDRLRAAVEANVGIPDLGPARVERAWRWRPAADVTLHVWVTCRGSGDTRACAVSFARAGAATVAVVGHEAAGWSVPQLGAVPDRASLVISGDDGRGAWRQYAQFAEGRVSFTRRQYADGL